MFTGPGVAYFSMEIALDSAIPTYSGGLGVLAGDMVRSCADLGVDLVGVSLLHRLGFFQQRLGPNGEQVEEPEPWRPDERLVAVDARVRIEVESRWIEIRAWRFDVIGYFGFVVPVYLLDTDVPTNHPDDRRLTDDLYLGDERHRLRQEAVLGLGGAALVRAVRETPVDRYHLNEGHAALVPLALIESFLASLPPEERSLEEALRSTREACVFTTHTPVPAGHDKFDWELARTVLGSRVIELLEAIGIKDNLNMTELALVCSRFVNGVAVRHGEVSRNLFPGYPIRSITNGVHAGTWVAPAMRELFDLHIPEWAAHPLSLRYASQIPKVAIAAAHRRSKLDLLARVREDTGHDLDPEALTIGFARRATEYKRSALIFHDLDQLARIAERRGAIQLVFAGKAHPRDFGGKGLIHQIFEAARALEGRIRVVYLPNYGMQLGLLLVSGCDVWLNNPIPPLEASGTSGMKAAMNGVPSLSVLDGWWVEGCIEGVTGWEIENGAIDAGEDPHSRDAHHAGTLYRKLDEVVAPLFYGNPDQFLEVRRQAIALNGSFFNAHRMVLQYLHEAYQPRGRLPEGTRWERSTTRSR